MYLCLCHCLRPDTDTEIEMSESVSYLMSVFYINCRLLILIVYLFTCISRKNDLEKRIEMFPAPQIGNTEMPPEDGFIWRKYGQKEILGRKYPR